MFEKNPIIRAMSNWFQRTFADPAAVSLFFFIILGLIFIELFSKLLMPVIVSIVLVYLLQAPVRLFERLKCPRLLAVIIVYVIFISLFILILFALVPLLWKQLTALVKQLPDAFSQTQIWLNDLMSRYPKLFGNIQLEQVIYFFKDQTAKTGQYVLRYSLATIPGLIQVVLYFVLVPLLVFFFLKDSKQILAWVSQYMPNNRRLAYTVWDEVHFKIGAYIRGRVLEIIILGFVATITFALFDLQYALLLGALVGLSVIVPYIGVVVVTIPVVIIALMQWGFSNHFWYLVSAYTAIAVLDGNLLAPLLLAEAVNLHPVVVILAVIFFGAIWGFWGIFFAIPLATLINAVLKAWPRQTAVNSR